MTFPQILGIGLAVGGLHSSKSHVTSSQTKSLIQTFLANVSFDINIHRTRPFLDMTSELKDRKIYSSPTTSRLNFFEHGINTCTQF